jgi:chemotaxis protein CheC
MTDVSPVPDAQALARDALLEVVNIGSGNALSSLSRLLGGDRVMPSVPELLTPEAMVGLADLDATGIMVTLNVTGAVPCAMLTLFDDAAASALVCELLGREPQAVFFGAEEESSVVEAVNIISCSFLGALASMLRGVLVPSAPVAVYGRLSEVIRDHLAADVWAVTSRFTASSATFSGRVVLVADPAAVATMLTALGVANASG